LSLPETRTIGSSVTVNCPAHGILLFTSSYQFESLNQRQLFPYTAFSLAISLENAQPTCYSWILGRKPTMSEETYKDLISRLETKHQYDLDGLRKVPQVWTKAEREKRGLTEKDIPDEFLTKEELN